MRAHIRLRGIITPLIPCHTLLRSSTISRLTQSSRLVPRRYLGSSSHHSIEFQIKVIVLHRNQPESQEPLYTVSTPVNSDEIVLESMPKAGWYAVHTGRQPGVYTSWPEAEAQVNGFNGAKHRKFSTKEEAQAYVGGAASTPQPAAPASQARVPLASTRHATSKAGPSAPKRPYDSGRASKTSSPPVDAAPTRLPPRLQSLSADGWIFTPQGKVVVYCDGSGINNGKLGARAGIGVWWSSIGNASKSNLSERVPGELQTNNRGELLAVIRALESCPLTDIPLEIRTDSEYTIMCMTTYLPLWLKKGLLDRPTKTTDGKIIKNLDLIKHLFVLLRERRAGVKFKHVRGHAGLEGNEQADRLAKGGADQPVLPDRTDWLDPATFQTADEAHSSDVEVELDEDCLMTEEELQALEEELA